MDETQRNKKRVDASEESAASEHRAVSDGVAVGELKERSRGVEAAGPSKASVASAKEFAARADREVGRRGLPLPPAADAGRGSDAGLHSDEERSLGVRLEVTGKQITVLDSLEVDVASPLPTRVRGTDFLAVRVGDELLALKSLIDPGMAYGIPDPKAPELGHREISLETYEVSVLVPLMSLDRLSARPSGAEVDAEPDAAVEVVMFHAPETTTIYPERADLAASLRGDSWTVVATSGHLTLDALRGTAWTDVTRKRDGVKPRPDEGGERPAAE